MNNLKYSDNPYLLQHANDPINWNEWNDKAFEKAKKENKLIFLSIGYSTCHWCHVMQKESFKNPGIADILNKYYISIKLDKEERPDIDKLYQKIYQLMHSRGGGWPLTIIMTPDKKVFFSATYIPPTYSQFGPGLKDILISIANDWQQNKEKIIKIAHNVHNIFKEYKIPQTTKIEDNIIEKIITSLSNMDAKYGGFKGSPKFPMESSLELLIDVYTITKNKQIENILNITLQKMALGGIFDQVEGGFYRYSTDEKWEIPHFEKMLYNNANLPFIYIRWYKFTKNDLFKEVAFRSLDEFINRYRDKNSLFFSASNADSEGIEGKYFVYYYDEVEKEFSIFENKDELLNYFNIKKYGNFNGKNNITLLDSKKPKNYQKALNILKKIRKKRKFPFIDTKKITSSNSMIISALFKASEIEIKYQKEAIKTLDTLLDIMYEKELFHSYNKNEALKTKGLLEDYAYLIKALIDGYTHTFNDKYLDYAKKLSQEVKKFKKDNKWFMSLDSILADFSDSSYASSLSILANSFLDLSLLTFDLELKNEADEIIKNGSYYINNYPLYYPTITKAYLKSNKAFIIKTKKPLFELETIYPYLLFKKGEEFEICEYLRCIKKSSNLTEIIKEI